MKFLRPCCHSISLPLLFDQPPVTVKEKTKDMSTFDRKAHWEHIYSDRKPTEVSWYQKRPEYSLELINAMGLDMTACIIDIGAGASTLIDYLLEAGYQNLTVLDIASAAIEQARARLGDRADKVVWLEHDITEPNVTELITSGLYDVWHDRAVFHFLTEANDRKAYVNTLSSVLKKGAHVIIATFALNGPEKCSGLEIVRYSPETMSAVLGDSFQLVETRQEDHVTPANELQSFVYCRFIRQ